MTLKHIAHGNEPPAPYFDWKFRSLMNPEVHSAGEVWANALWHCARNLLADASRFDFETRRRRMLAHLVAALKLFPVDADYVEARNAVLFAMRSADATDYELCRRGFAQRGFGAGALAPQRYDTTMKDVRESFSANDAALSFVDWRLEETAGGDGDGVLDVGESGRLTVTVKNTGLVPLDQVQVYVPPMRLIYALPSGGTAGGISLQANEEYTTSFDVEILTHKGASMVPFNLTATDAVRTDIYGQQDARFTVNYDLARDRNDDWAVSQQTFEADWTVGSEGRHACAFFCIGDLTNWERVVHLGEYAYRIGSDRLALNAYIATVPFRVYPTVPLRIVMRHDHDFVGSGIYSADGAIEVNVAGRWEPLSPYVVSGASHYGGTSGGWTTRTIDLGTAFGSRTIQLRWRMNAQPSFAPAPVHWAISRISIQGAATPVFSSMYNDVDWD